MRKTFNRNRRMQASLRPFPGALFVTTLLLTTLTLVGVIVLCNRAPATLGLGLRPGMKLSSLRSTQSADSTQAPENSSELFRSVPPPASCGALMQLLEETIESKLPLYIRGAVAGLGGEFFTEDVVAMGDSLRGSAAVSPNSTFKVFHNSADYMRVAASEEADRVLPNRLQTMTFKEYRRRIAGELPPLFYTEHEEYAWQVDAPHASVQRLMALPIMHCFHWAIMPRPRPRDVHAALAAEPTRVRLDTIMFRAARAGTRQYMHYDVPHGVILVLTGVKNVTLIPADQLELLYPVHDTSDFLRARARFDLQSPDYVRYPLARQLTPMTITCRPGDLLLFPERLAHETKSVTDVTSLALRFHL